MDQIDEWFCASLLSRLRAAANYRIEEEVVGSACGFDPHNSKTRRRFAENVKLQMESAG